MFLRNKRIATLHGTILFIGTLIGFFGRYFQFNDVRLTALIPGSVGCLIIGLANVNWAKEKTRTIAFFLVILLFGIVLTRMSVKFLSQDLQPLRKRINFPLMAISSLVAGALIARNCLKRRKEF